MPFPENRPRRLRRTVTWRRMLRETVLSSDDLVYPMFVVPGEGVSNPVPSMPGIEQLSIDRIVDEAVQAHNFGVTDWESASRADGETFAQYFWGMLNRGIYLAPSQFESLFLSAAHTEEDIDATVDAAQAALQEIL